MQQRRAGAGATGELVGRVLLGGIAGIVGTAAMTAAMRALHRRLPPRHRYPLPPREIVQRVMPEAVEAALDERSRQDLTIAAHFGYGAGTGALYALAGLPTGPVSGAGYGVLIWTASYLGWIPASRILKPATNHPLRRDVLMIAVHLVWGATMAATLRELQRAGSEAFGSGEIRDAPSSDPT